MQKVRATALVVKNEKVLMIHRFRDGLEYYVLPGGGVEEGETIEEAAVRELKEETNLEGGNLVKLDDSVDEICRTVLFSVEIIGSYDAKIREDSSEYKKRNKNNQYILEWVSKEELLFLTIWPMQTREFLFKYFKLA